MTIDDAIKHAEEVAEENDKHKENMRKRYGEHIAGYKMYCKCAEEYRQLAEWLKELKTKEEINQSLLYENERLLKSVQEIKAEIEERKKNSGGEPNRELAFNICLDVIDKHMNWEDADV